MTTLDEFIQGLSLGALSEWLWGPGLTVVLIILIITLINHFAGKLIEKLVRHTLRHSRFSNIEANQADLVKRQDTLIGLFTAITHAAIWVIGFVMILEAVLRERIDFTPLFASAGIIGVAIGFGAQSLIKDFLTGIFIITENQYRVGDVVEIDTGNGATGTVEKVSVRSTVVRDVDGNVHYVPNGNIAHVINKTMGYSRVNLTITVLPDTDIDKLVQVINDTGRAMADSQAWADKIIEAPSFTFISTFSDVAMEVIIGGKTQPSQQWSVTGELRRQLLSAFKKNDIHLAHTPLATLSPAVTAKKKR